MTLKLYDANKAELMAVSRLERDGDELVIKGKIYGAMPMTARLRPDDARKIFGLLNIRLVFFILSLPFRRRRGNTAEQRSANAPK